MKALFTKLNVNVENLMTCSLNGQKVFFVEVTTKPSPPTSPPAHVLIKVVDYTISGVDIPIQTLQEIEEPVDMSYMVHEEGVIENVRTKWPGGYITFVNKMQPSFANTPYSVVVYSKDFLIIAGERTFKKALVSEKTKLLVLVDVHELVKTSNTSDLQNAYNGLNDILVRESNEYISNLKKLLSQCASLKIVSRQNIQSHLDFNVQTLAANKAIKYAIETFNA